MDENLKNKLVDEAKKIALKNTCCGYSKYSVGVALLTSTGKIYAGFNVENDGIQSICAERVTIAKALTEDNKEFKGLAVVGKNLDEDSFKKTLPCGYCRQFMAEYCGEDFDIIAYDDKENKMYEYKLGDLLPESFHKE